MNKLKDGPLKSTTSKGEMEDDEALIEVKEDYTMIDDDDNIAEPKGPGKDELKSTQFLTDDDDDDDDDDDF